MLEKLRKERKEYKTDLKSLEIHKKDLESRLDKLEKGESEKL